MPYKLTRTKTSHQEPPRSRSKRAPQRNLEVERLEDRNMLSGSPPNPLDLTSFTTSASTIDLSWTSGGGATAGFVVAYQEGTAPRNKCTDGTQVDIGNMSSHTISGLEPDTPYSFRVCAYDLSGNNSRGITGLQITDPPAGGTQRNAAIAVSDDFVYVGGSRNSSSSTSNWRLERRLKSDNSLAGGGNWGTGILDIDARAPYTGDQPGWAIQQIATDTSGNIYVCGQGGATSGSWTNHGTEVYKIAPDGSTVWSWTSPEITGAQTACDGMVIDDTESYLYVHYRHYTTAYVKSLRLTDADESHFTPIIYDDVNLNDTSRQSMSFLQDTDRLVVAAGFTGGLFSGNPTTQTLHIYPVTGGSPVATTTVPGDLDGIAVTTGYYAGTEYVWTYSRGDRLLRRFDADLSQEKTNAGPGCSRLDLSSDFSSNGVAVPAHSGGLVALAIGNSAGQDSVFLAGSTYHGVDYPPLAGVVYKFNMNGNGDPENLGTCVADPAINYSDMPAYNDANFSQGAGKWAFDFGDNHFSRLNALTIDENNDVFAAGYTRFSNGNEQAVSLKLDGDLNQGNNQPPTAAAGGPYAGVEDGAVLFDASGSSDPELDTLSYHWDFGDGTTANTTSPTMSHTYAWGGSFAVTLTVNDGKGGADASTTITTITEVNDVPSADIGGPYSGTEGVPMVFDASASVDSDNEDGTNLNDQPLEYTWDFGDGSAAVTTLVPTTSYTYLANGVYNVSVTVDDGTASDIDLTTATIAAAPVGDPNSIYVWDIYLDQRTRGSKHDARIFVDVNRDSNADGIASGTDGGAAGVMVTIDLREAGPDGIFETADDSVIGPFSGLTDSAGIYSSGWIRNLGAGTYRAEVVDLAHATFNWNQFLTANDDDEDGDGLPDELFTIPA